MTNNKFTMEIRLSDYFSLRKSMSGYCEMLGRDLTEIRDKLLSLHFEKVGGSIFVQIRSDRQIWYSNVIINNKLHDDPSGRGLNLIGLIINHGGNSTCIEFLKFMYGPLDAIGSIDFVSYGTKHTVVYNEKGILYVASHRITHFPWLYEWKKSDWLIMMRDADCGVRKLKELRDKIGNFNGGD